MGGPVGVELRQNAALFDEIVGSRSIFLSFIRHLPMISRLEKKADRSALSKIESGRDVLAVCAFELPVSLLR